MNALPAHSELDLVGQTVLVIGGSAGIGLETARLARDRAAEVIPTARNPDPLHRAGLELGATIVAFDATDFDRLQKFFDELPTPIDHVLVTGPGPHYAPFAEFDIKDLRRNVDAHLFLPLQTYRCRRPSSATSWTRVENSSVTRCLSDASLSRLTSRHLRST